MWCLLKPGGEGVHWLMLFGIMWHVPDGIYCCSDVGINGVELVKVVVDLVVWVVLYKWRMKVHWSMPLWYVFGTLVSDCLKFLYDDVLV